MMDTVGTLVRRGSQIHAQFSQNQPDIKFPNWAVPILVLIGVTFAIALICVEYTYGTLIPTLIMVEDPNATKYDSLETSDPLLDFDSNKKATIEPEILVKPKPVTYSFRTTLAHLRARGGRCSRFRGFASYMIASVVIGHLTRFITFIGVIPFRHFIAPILATTIAAHFLLLWTHIAISEPSQKRWYKRFAPLRTWKKIAAPTAISMFLQQLAVFVPMMLFMELNARTPTPRDANEWASMGCRDRSMLIIKGFGIVALSFVLWLLVALPAKVSLIRVQASLLSEEEEPIVPFDRSFGGKVVPAIVGGSGVLRMVDAWKTFSCGSRFRLVKAYVKVVAIQIALSILFVGAAIAVAVTALGPDNLKKIADGLKKEGHMNTTNA